MNIHKLKNFDFFAPEDQLEQPLSPLRNYSPNSAIVSPFSNITPRTIAKASKFGKFEYTTIFQILQKLHSTRTHNQLRFINEFIRKTPGLERLGVMNGIQFCKGIMRSAQLEEYQQLQIVEKKKQQISCVYVVLQGKVGSFKNEDESDMIENISDHQVYEILMSMSRKEIKKLNKLTRKFSTYRDQYSQKHQKYTHMEENQLLQTFEKGETIGDKTRCLHKEHTHTTVALQKSLLLSVDMKNMFFWLNHSFELKLQKSYSLLKQHPCFAHIESETLQQIIGFMTITRKRKNQSIYVQGSQPTHIYFLQQGELKIQKQSNLFVQNPNQLYIDRRKLMSERQLNNKQYLPYADLHSLYNYRPIKKTVQLGIITPFCIFGEEEMLQNRTRQTTIKCASLQSVYYGIELKKMYQTLSQKLPLFMQAIKNSLREKVRYRQNVYATTINLQNKNNLKYFYFEGETSLPTPRKYIIKKINQKMHHQQQNNSIVSNSPTPNKRRVDSQMYSMNQSQISQDRHYEVKQYTQQKVNPELSLTARQKNRHLQIPPSFNTFNFHKMMKTKLVKADLSAIVIDDEGSQSQTQKLHKLQLNKKGKVNSSIQQEQKIIGNSHTWRLVKDKVNKEVKLSKKIGSLKYNIDFAAPLIDEKFFRNIDGEMKRIQRQRKNGKFNVSVPKSRALSLNLIATNR